MVGHVKAVLKSICTILASIPLSNEFCRVWDTQKCITSTQSLRHRHQMLKKLRQYWCYANRSVIGNGGKEWIFRNLSDIGMSHARRETTQTNRLPKHHTKTGGQNISSLKKKRKHAQFKMDQCHHNGPSLTRESWPCSIWRQSWLDQDMDGKWAADQLTPCTACCWNDLTADQPY